jgi:hypothetical protein
LLHLYVVVNTRSLVAGVGLPRLLGRCPCRGCGRTLIIVLLKVAFSVMLLSLVALGCAGTLPFAIKGSIGTQVQRITVVKRVQAASSAVAVVAFAIDDLEKAASSNSSSIVQKVIILPVLKAFIKAVDASEKTSAAFNIVIASSSSFIR